MDQQRCDIPREDIENLIRQTLKWNGNRRGKQIESRISEMMVNNGDVERVMENKRIEEVRGTGG